jgi:plastocyanin
MAIFLALSGAALAAEWTVHVGRGGTKFVDDVSGTKVSTIVVGDAVTWVWEGNMSHSVTSGSCPSNGGGGGYVYGGGSCTANQAWQSGLHAAGFTFSHTFSSVGTFSYFCDAHGNSMTGSVVVQAATTTGPCEPQPETLCLNGGRFKVQAEWERPDGSSGHGTGKKLTDDSGYFWFFSDTNIEVVVKVLNFCFPPFNSYSVFSSGLTDVGVTLTVRDTQTGAVYPYVNPLTSPGTIYVTQPATSAFPSSCP